MKKLRILKIKDLIGQSDLLTEDESRKILGSTGGGTDCFFQVLDLLDDHMGVGSNNMNGSQWQAAYVSAFGGSGAAINEAYNTGPTLAHMESFLGSTFKTVTKNSDEVGGFMIGIIQNPNGEGYHAVAVTQNLDDDGNVMVIDPQQNNAQYAVDPEGGFVSTYQISYK